MLIIEFPRPEISTGITVRLSRGVAVMQVCRDYVLTEAAVTRRQVIAVADEDGPAVSLDVERAGYQPVKAPERLSGEIRMCDEVCQPLLDLVKLDRRKLV